MLLDFQNRVAFVLIPKNASSSVRQTLMKHDQVGIFCNQDAHQGLEVYDYTFMDLEGWERVAIIRNPLDRHVSWWRYERRVFGSNVPICTAQPTQMSYIQGDVGVTRILRYENLDEDWSDFASECGYPRELMHLNKTPDGQPYPEAPFIGWAQEMYLEDYEEFGYPLMDEVSP